MDPSNLQQHQHQQGMATHTPTFEDVLNCPSAKELQERQKRSLMNRPQPEALKCPRCDSSNTKFCYYNNYSLTQPRYFCKACRRYWTKGGSLRNVPVGGGCRKNNKRISSCSSSSATSKAKSSPSSSISSHHHLHHHHHHQDNNNNNQIYLNTTNSIINPLLTFPSSLGYDTNDLTLAFGRLHKQQPTTTRQLGFDHEHHQSSYGNTNSIIGNLINSSSNSINTANPGFIDALRSGFLDPSNGFHNFYSNYGNGISMGDLHQQQQQVESNNSKDYNGGSISNGNCHEEDDDQQHQRDEQVVLPNYDQVEMGLTSTTSSTVTTATKQELLKDNETKILWNFPWHGQFGGEQQANHHHHNNNSIHNNIMGNVIDTSSGVRDWNGLNGWHGLVNSPLM